MILLHRWRILAVEQAGLSFIRRSKKQVEPTWFPVDNISLGIFLKGLTLWMRRCCTHLIRPGKSIKIQKQPLLWWVVQGYGNQAHMLPGCCPLAWGRPEVSPKVMTRSKFCKTEITLNFRVINILRIQTDLLSGVWPSSFFIPAADMNIQDAAKVRHETENATIKGGGTLQTRSRGVRIEISLTTTWRRSETST